MATKPKTDDTIRRRISFEPEIHQALHQLALARTATLQERPTKRSGTCSGNTIAQWDYTRCVRARG